MMSRNLALRLVSALVLIPLVFAALIKGGGAFDGFVFLMLILSCYEWFKITKNFELRLVYLLLGFLYFLCSLFMFSMIRDSREGLYLAITLMMLIWASDTMAYIFGRSIGGKKLAPSISPNKTWAGMIGSTIGAAAIYSLMIFYSYEIYNWYYNSIRIEPIFFNSHPFHTSFSVLLLCGAFFGVVGQIGDLLESYMKRKAGVKDSSNLIPGHGGVLDRIDALLLVIPFYFFAWKFLL